MTLGKNDESSQTPVFSRYQKNRLIAFGLVLLVLALGAVIFIKCKYDREREIQASYSDIVAHVGEQIEKSVSSYNEIWDNLIPDLDDFGSDAWSSKQCLIKSFRDKSLKAHHSELNKCDKYKTECEVDDRQSVKSNTIENGQEDADSKDDKFYLNEENIQISGPNSAPASESLDKAETEKTLGCLVNAILKSNDMPQKNARVRKFAPSPSSERIDIALSPDYGSFLFPIGNDYNVKLPAGEILPSVITDTPNPNHDYGKLDAFAFFDNTGKVLKIPSSSKLRLEELPRESAGAFLISTVFRDVEINGKEYALFLHPIRINIAVPEDSRGRLRASSSASEKIEFFANNRIILCGIVSEDRLLDECLRVAPWWYLLAAFLLGLSFVAFPLAKLWWLGPEARFTLFDSTMLFISAILFVCVCTILAWSTIAQSTLENRADETLNETSKKISEKLTDSLKSAVQTLDDFISCSGSQRKDILAGSEKEPFDFESYNTCSSHTTLSTTKRCGPNTLEAFPSGTTDNRIPIDSDCSKNSNHLKTICEAPSHCYDPQNDNKRPDWRLVFWSDEEGKQRLKCSSSDYLTSFIDVEQKEYFKEAIKERTRCLSPATECIPLTQTAPDDKQRLRASAHIIRSATTREIKLILSRPTYDDEKNLDPTGVAAVETDLDSVNDTILPSGVILAIVDRTGKTLLHSKGDEYYGHNIFNNINHNDAAELRAVFNIKQPDTIDLQYFGRRMRMHVQYLPGPDWYLILQLPTGSIDGPIYHMAVISLLWFCVLVVSLLVIITILTIFSRILRLLLMFLRNLIIKDKNVDTRSHNTERVFFLIWTWVFPAILILFFFLSFLSKLFTFITIFALVAFFMIRRSLKKAVCFSLRPQRYLSKLYTGVGGLTLFTSSFIALNIVFRFMNLTTSLLLWTASILLSVWPLFVNETRKSIDAQGYYKQKAKVGDIGWLRYFLEYFGGLVSRHVLPKIFPYRQGRHLPFTEKMSRECLIWYWGAIGTLIFVPLISCISISFKIVARNAIQMEQLHYAEALEDRGHEDMIHLEMCRTCSEEDCCMPHTIAGLYKHEYKCEPYIFSWPPVRPLDFQSDTLNELISHFLPRDHIGYNDRLRYTGVSHPELSRRA